MRSDGQEPDRRRERWASGPLTAKPVSIKGAERKSGGRARKADGITSGGLRRVPRVSGLDEPRDSLTAAQKSAEGIVERCRRSA